MKVLFYHSGSIPVKKYGGTERIVYWLMKELVKRGHEILLLGDPKSSVEKIGARLIPISHEDWRQQIPSDVDIVHLFEPTKLEIKQPHLLTVEGNGQIGEIFPKNTVFVSRKHAENHGSDAVVYNGMDLSEYPFKVRRWQAWDSFIFLAKASWKVKNLRHCIDVCRSSGKNLYIAGGRAFSFSPRIHSMGMLDQKQKNDLLMKVDALLFPVRWHEPFGIAIVEAMAMGLPVIGSSYGSLPELITKETGMICKDYAEFSDAVSKERNVFDAGRIRKYVEDKFSSSVMADNYLAYYKKVTNGETINKTNPQWKLPDPPQTLLHF